MRFHRFQNKLKQCILFTLLILIETSFIVNSKSAFINNGFAVVELFTSEGCSSCPPADAIVASVLKEYANNVYVLCYHVDYWDSLGWKDAYSNAAYSERQKAYAKVFNLSDIYTPQIIVNGKKQFVGSDVMQLHDVINKDLKRGTDQSLIISAKQVNNNTINVSYQTEKRNEDLNIVLIQLAAQTHVQRGENNGAILHHVNIVRDFKTIALKKESGNIIINLPALLNHQDCRIIAFIQNVNSLRVTTAAETDIQLQ